MLDALVDERLEDDLRARHLPAGWFGLRRPLALRLSLHFPLRFGRSGPFLVCLSCWSFRQ
ncbi:MAG: hypothetical protein WDM84_05640 [Bauldia sp.]